MSERASERVGFFIASKYEEYKNLSQKKERKNKLNLHYMHNNYET